MKKATTTTKKRKSHSNESKGADSPSHLIDARIKELNDWRGETLARVRMLIRQADPEVLEEVKWRKPSKPGGVPVWSHVTAAATARPSAVFPLRAVGCGRCRKRFVRPKTPRRRVV